MTLNGYFALNSVFASVWLASYGEIFEYNCVKTKKAKHVLSATLIFGGIDFWQCLYGYSRRFSRKEASKDSAVAR